MKKTLIIFSFFLLGNVGCTLSDPEMMELLQEIKAQNDKLLQEVEAMKGQLSLLDGKYQVILASLVDNKKELEALKSQIDALKAQIAQQLIKIDQLSIQLTQQGADIVKLSAEIEELKASIEELKGLIEELLSGKSPVPTNGLVAWYPFNGNANDESGNSFNGIENKANLVEDRKGKLRNAYSLDGVSSFISIPANSKILPSQLTLAVWVSIPVEYSGNNVVGRIIRSRFFGYALTYRTDDDLVNFEVWTNSSASSSSICYSQNKKMNDGIWHLIVGTFDGKDIRLFVDGVELGKVTTPNSSIFYSSDGFIYFGRDGNNSSSETALFQGKVDDIAIYNRALTAEEISKIYKGENF